MSRGISVTFFRTGVPRTIVPSSLLGGTFVVVLEFGIIGVVLCF